VVMNGTVTNCNHIPICVFCACGQRISSSCTHVQLGSPSRHRHQQSLSLFSKHLTKAGWAGVLPSRTPCGMCCNVEHFLPDVRVARSPVGGLRSVPVGQTALCRCLILRDSTECKLNHDNTDYRAQPCFACHPSHNTDTALLAIRHTFVSSAPAPPQSRSLPWSSRSRPLLSPCWP